MIIHDIGREDKISKFIKGINLGKKYTLWVPIWKKWPCDPRNWDKGKYGRQAGGIIYKEPKELCKSNLYCNVEDFQLNYLDKIKGSKERERKI